MRSAVVGSGDQLAVALAGCSRLATCLDTGHKVLLGLRLTVTQLSSPVWRTSMLVVSTVLVGCSGDGFSSDVGQGSASAQTPPTTPGSASTQPGPPSGAPPTAMLSSLSPAERNALCDQLLVSFDEGVDRQRLLEVSCTQRAWSATPGNAAACDDGRRVCLNGPMPPRLSTAAQVSCEEYVGLDDQCVSVMAIHTCYRDFGTAFDQEFLPLQTNPRTCSAALTNPPIPLEGAVLIDPPESCRAVVDEACGGALP